MLLGMLILKKMRWQWLNLTKKKISSICFSFLIKSNLWNVRQNKRKKYKFMKIKFVFIFLHQKSKLAWFFHSKMWKYFVIYIFLQTHIARAMERKEITIYFYPFSHEIMKRRREVDEKRIKNSFVISRETVLFFDGARRWDEQCM